MKTEEARGYTIQKLNTIEITIDQIITNYFSPKNLNNFNNILLNSSILEFGKKVKLISSLDLIDKTTFSDLLKLASIRNSFAHAEIRNVTHYTTGEKNTLAEIKKMIVVMNSNGKISKKYISEFLIEFDNLFNKLTIKLDEVSKAVANMNF
ncbi:hypothetical protein [Olleya sp. UBA1516]|uniref:hypothetical protein n=1 Tax=Olleya sp. UBA1516 TaxID=1947013 RepID=UPI0025CDD9BD|nr:hypothetical protein [Olleya sp. UBA1516]|tara:strand:+ start:9534 stop:9986 length:453 start_codon:yes stop_codon:yes gene_type:complete